MAYYQSNEPYNKQDGLGNGFMMGAAFGGAGVAGAHFGGGALLNKKREGIQTKGDARMSKIQSQVKDGTLTKESGANLSEGREKMTAGKLSSFENSRANRYHNKAFGGSWKGKVAAYGGGVLAGGLAGAGLDAANKSGR